MYLVFQWEHYEQNGGMFDSTGLYPTLDEAIASVTDRDWNIRSAYIYELRIDGLTAVWSKGEYEAQE